MYNFYKASCLFDPRQLSCISLDIDSFAAIKDLQDSSTDLLEEFQIHGNYQDDLPNPFLISQHFEMQIRVDFPFWK